MKQTQTRAYNVRAADKPLIVEGTVIVFDKPADMGGYTEFIARNALDGVNLDNITLLVNHNGTGIPLARSPKTLTLTISETGLDMRAELPDTEQGRSVYEAIKRGDLSEMSFAFEISEYAFDEQKRECTITKIAAVYEISIVNRAAYPQTSVQARAGKEVKFMNHFNPIESAVLNTAAVNPDTTPPRNTAAHFISVCWGKN